VVVVGGGDVPVAGARDRVAMVPPAHPQLLLVVVRELGLVFHGHGDRVAIMVLPPAHPQLLLVVRELALAVHGNPAVARGIRGRGGDGVEDGVELRDDVLGPGGNRRKSAPAVLRGGAPLRELEVLAHGVPAADVAVGLGSERARGGRQVEGDGGECDPGVIGARGLGGQPRLHLRRPRALRGGDGWREEASGPGVEVVGGGGGGRESPATLHPRC
jgi:hypothetical protein